MVDQGLERKRSAYWAEIRAKSSLYIIVRYVWELGGVRCRYYYNISIIPPFSEKDFEIYFHGVVARSHGVLLNTSTGLPLAK